MTDKQLAELEQRAEAAYRAEQIRRMEQAMKAVNEVSRQHNRTGMTYGIVRNKQIKDSTHDAQGPQARTFERAGERNRQSINRREQ